MKEGRNVPKTPWYHIHWFKFVKDTGVNIYSECRCGGRKIVAGGEGYQPFDRDWLLSENIINNE